MITNTVGVEDSKVQKLLIPLLFATILFFIPISSSGKSISLILAILAVLLNPHFRAHITTVLKEPYVKTAGLLFLVVFFSLGWTDANLKESTLVLEKYSKLLYFPLLVVGFKEKATRQISLYAFIAAMVITCFLSYLKFFNLVDYHGIDPGHVFRNHIMTGYMMAFAAYLSLFLALKATGLKKLILLFFYILFSMQIWLVNTGKTGYFIYLLLTFLFILHYLSLRQAMIAILVCLLTVSIIYTENKAVNERVNQLVYEWEEFKKEKKDTSLGYRLQFHSFAYELWLRKPILGNGAGSFTHTFSIERPVPSWDRKLLEPHSQYWLTASELGLLGLAALGAFFISLFRSSLKLRENRFIAFSVLIPFLVGNLSDSLLFYSGTGYLFIVFMSLCLGERLSINKKL